IFHPKKCFALWFTLDLGLNLISHIEDAALSHLSSLTELSLARNRLTNLTDHMFTGLSNLTVLDLSENKINRISLLAFAPLTKLLEVSLWDNHLSSISDIVNIVSFCPLLKSLDLSENPLTTPLSRFSLHSDVFPHLQTLHLASVYNDLQWEVSDETLLKSVRTLDLRLTNFTDETYQLIFQSLESLEKLSLSNVARLNRGLLDGACGIQTLQTLYLIIFTLYLFIFLGWALISLWLQPTPFEQVNFLNDSLLLPCSNLTELDLSVNLLKDLGPSSLQMLTHLSRLNLAMNSLTEVPLTIRNMSSLTSLTLRENSISNLRCLDFSGLHLLKILDLSYNKLTELNSCAFQDLQNLQKLYIEKNKIHIFDSISGITLPNLLVLEANGNYIAELYKGVFRNMTRLTDLDLNSESVLTMDVFPGTFDGLTDLRTLSMSPVCIFDSPSAGVGPQSSSRGRSQLQQVFNLPSLQTLSVTVCDFVCIGLTKDLLQGLDDLKLLSFKSGLIDSETFHHTPRLLRLEIRNAYKWIPVPELFQPLTVLQTLDLSENHLNLWTFSLRLI
uniref:Uncharacterized protein n=1 Tax=Neogobius melanostomus TaxID=47308 RepID=A0A8C6SB76_9GOBI